MSVKTIDDYLANVTPAAACRPRMSLRGQIKAAAPGAEECISYGQPAFRKGRVVCGFGATKKHCALYMFSDTTLDALASDLAGYDVSKGTVRFQPDQTAARLPREEARQGAGCRVRGARYREEGQAAMSGSRIDHDTILLGASLRRFPACGLCRVVRPHCPRKVERLPEE